MLRIKSLLLEDFGPFKGQQSILFPEQDGVVIVYGENMRGKTIFLNAIRYALFGRIVSRGSKEVSLHLISNWEQALQGKYGFRVVLSFSYAGHEYELTRDCHPRTGSIRPERDSDYEQTSFLREDGHVLGPHDKDLTLARVMPEEVSRFFLFDGELLQEYEELLRHESEMGERIKQAIERILGVPILTQARSHLRNQYQRAQKLESKAAQQDQKTQELGIHLTALTDERVFHEQEIQRFSRDLEELRRRRTGLMEVMRRNERTRYFLQETDRVTEEVTAIGTRIDEQISRVQELLSDSWLGLLKGRITALLDSSKDELHRIQSEQTKRAAEEAFLESLSAALDANKCPVCARSLDAESREAVAEAIHNRSLQTPKAEVSRPGFQELVAMISLLERFVQRDHLPVLKEVLHNLDELHVEKVAKTDRIGEIKELTKDVDQTQVRSAYSEYSRIEKEIAILEHGVQGERQKLQEIEANIRKLQGQLDKLGGVSTSTLRRRRELCDALVNLMHESVDEYRNRLRLRVEADATELFINLISEPEYARLRINDSYGLEIVHRDGQPIQIRSAGAEHVVALSLMGALQKNSPLSGPVIMDSPFGRLDEVHTNRVVLALPSIAKQVILLVYESELNPPLAREMLLGNLLAEYKLDRKTARHTVINTLKEGN
jgi:DNA sulfur modification protein DndD